MTQQVTTLVHKLQAWLQQEIEAQGKLFEQLSLQEQAIREANTKGIVDSGAAIQEELRAAGHRERRRATILRGLGKAWGVDPQALSITSIGERIGIGTVLSENLLRLRLELRIVASKVAKLGRRIAALARYHGALFNELMHAIFGVEGEGSGDGGVLVNARA